MRLIRQVTNEFISFFFLMQNFLEDYVYVFT